jgi:excisionase family DNA binding protein
MQFDDYDIEEEGMTISEAATYLGVTKQLIYNITRSRRVTFPLTEEKLDAYLAGRQRINYYSGK